MTTMADTIVAIRRLLQDAPDEDFITLGVDADDTPFTVNDITKWGKGQVWEATDGSDDCEVVLVRSTDESADTVAVKRAHADSTAASHDADSVWLKDPRFRYNTIAQAVTTVLDTDLYGEDVYDLQEHTVTSNSDGSRDYDAPNSECREWLSVAQLVGTMTEPYFLRSGLEFHRLPVNVASAIAGTGKMFWIGTNIGTPGTDVFYVTCTHPLTLDTLTSAQERIVQWLACAYLLEWTEPHRTAGPTNQGDRTVRPNTALQTAAYFRQLATRAMANERARLRKLNPPQRNFRR